MPNQPTTFDRIRFFNGSGAPVTGFTYTPKRGAANGTPVNHPTPIPAGTEVRKDRAQANAPEEDHPGRVEVVVRRTQAGVAKTVTYDFMAPVQLIVPAPPDGIRRLNIEFTYVAGNDFQFDWELVHDVYNLATGTVTRVLTYGHAVVAQV